MSTNTQIHIGPYLLCKTGNLIVDEDVRVCSKTQKHEQDQEADDQFCSKCGSKVHTVKVGRMKSRSLGYVQWEKDEDEWTKDEKKLLSRFHSVQSCDIGIKDRYDVLLVNEFSRSYWADEEKFYNVKPDIFTKMASQVNAADLALLEKVMKYKSIVVKYGVLIQLC